MGTYYKIYLTDVESSALQLLQEKREAAGGNAAANALFKEALRASLLQEGVAEWAPGIGEGQPPLFRAVKPKPLAQTPTPARGVRRRRRRA